MLGQAMYLTKRAVLVKGLEKKLNGIGYDNGEVAIEFRVDGEPKTYPSVGNVGIHIVSVPVGCEDVDCSVNIYVSEQVAEMVINSEMMFLYFFDLLTDEFDSVYAESRCKK